MTSSYYYEEFTENVCAAKGSWMNPGKREERLFEIADKVLGNIQYDQRFIKGVRRQLGGIFAQESLNPGHVYNAAVVLGQLIEHRPAFFHGMPKKLGDALTRIPAEMVHSLEAYGIARVFAKVCGGSKQAGARTHGMQVLSNILVNGPAVPFLGIPQTMIDLVRWNCPEPQDLDVLRVFELSMAIKAWQAPPDSDQANEWARLRRAAKQNIEFYEKKIHSLRADTRQGTGAAAPV